MHRARARACRREVSMLPHALGASAERLPVEKQRHVDPSIHCSQQPHANSVSPKRLTQRTTSSTDNIYTHMKTRETSYLGLRNEISLARAEAVLIGWVPSKHAARSSRQAGQGEAAQRPKSALATHLHDLERLEATLDRRHERLLGRLERRDKVRARADALLRRQRAASAAASYQRQALAASPRGSQSSCSRASNRTMSQSTSHGALSLDAFSGLRVADSELLLPTPKDIKAVRTQWGNLTATTGTGGLPTSPGSILTTLAPTRQPLSNGGPSASVIARYTSIGASDEPLPWMHAEKAAAAAASESRREHMPAKAMDAFKDAVAAASPPARTKMQPGVSSQKRNHKDPVPEYAHEDLGYTEEMERAWKDDIITKLAVLPSDWKGQWRARARDVSARHALTADRATVWPQAAGKHVRSVAMAAMEAASKSSPDGDRAELIRQRDEAAKAAAEARKQVAEARIGLATLQVEAAVIKESAAKSVEEAARCKHAAEMQILQIRDEALAVA